jgi:GT2 family glycosyltransferase
MKKKKPGRVVSLTEIGTLAPGLSLPCTICALLFGDHVALARRLLESLFHFTDPSVFHLRLGLNAVSNETDRLVADHESRYPNVTVVRSTRNIFKCPMMRRLFYDEPIETRWTIWFDDDSYVHRADWLLGLGLAIQSESPLVALWGSQHYVAPGQRVCEFIRTAKWYRGMPLSCRANGDAVIQFPTGGFWAIRTDVIYELGWPDPRLMHYEDDYILGEAVRQIGKLTAHYRGGVVINDAPRRSAPGTPTELRIEHSLSGSFGLLRRPFPAHGSDAVPR